MLLKIHLDAKRNYGNICLNGWSFTLVVARRTLRAHEIALFNACSRNASENQRFCNIVRIADGGESEMGMEK